MRSGSPTADFEPIERMAGPPNALPRLRRKHFDGAVGGGKLMRRRTPHYVDRPRLPRIVTAWRQACTVRRRCIARAVRWRPCRRGTGVAVHKRAGARASVRPGLGGTLRPSRTCSLMFDAPSPIGTR